MITPEKLLEAAKQLEPQLQEWRRTLHRHPEVGFDLPQTKALVQKALTDGHSCIPFLCISYEDVR